MAFQDNSAGPEKHTGYTHEGREIILSKTRGRPTTGIATRPGWYPDEKRIEVATLFAVTGSRTAVEGLTGVPAATIGGWTRQDWFKQLLDDIRAENDHIIDAKTTEIVVKALDQVSDRIDNGDFVLTRGGELLRKPVNAKDLSIVTAINIDKRQLLRGKPTSRSEQVSNKTIEDKLNHLAESFRQIAKAKPTKGVDLDADYKTLDIQDADILSESATPTERHRLGVEIISESELPEVEMSGKGVVNDPRE